MRSESIWSETWNQTNLVSLTGLPELPYGENDMSIEHNLI
jgi:hypothetical protein